MPGGHRTCVVFLLGHPGMGKRTIGTELADLLDGVLVDKALINRPILELFRWDGRAPLPEGIWDRVTPIRDAVLATIEELAPPSTSYMFTNVLFEGDPSSVEVLDRVRFLAARRGPLFLAVVLDTTETPPRTNAEKILQALVERGYHPAAAGVRRPGGAAAP